LVPIHFKFIFLQAVGGTAIKKDFEKTIVLTYPSLILTVHYT